MNKKIPTIQILLVIGLLTLAIPAQAEILHLKSGITVEGNLVDQNTDYVELDTHGVKIRYYVDEIEKIEDGELPRKDITVRTYADDLMDIDESISESLDQYMWLFSQITQGEITDKRQSMQLVMEGAALIENASEKIKNVNVAPEGEVFKQTMLDYYESMLGVQAAVLKFINKSSDAMIALDDATARLVKKEEAFNRELSKMSIKTFMRSQALQGISREKAEQTLDVVSGIESLSEELRNENEVLKEETKDLIAINRQLQKETQILIEENKALKKELIMVLERTITHATTQQKQKFLRYIRGL